MLRGSSRPARGEAIRVVPSSSPPNFLEDVGWGGFPTSHIKIKESTGEAAFKRLKSNRLSLPPGKGTQPTSCSSPISLNKWSIALSVTESAKSERNSSAGPAAASTLAHVWL